MRVTRYVERGELVAVGVWHGRVAVGPQLWVSPGAWAAFVAGVRDGRFDASARSPDKRNAADGHDAPGGWNAPGRHRWRTA